MKRQFKISKFLALFFSLLLIGCTNDGKEITTPAEATNLTAVTEGGQAVLSWTKPVDSDTKEYWITIDPLIVDAFPIDKNLESYTIDNLNIDTKYTFTLFVKNQSGGVSKGVSASVTPIYFSAISKDQKITLKWTKPTAIDFASYELICEPGGKSFALDKEINSYIIDGLTNGIQYTIVLKTKDLVGNILSSSSIKTIPKIDITPPADASNITFSGDYKKLRFTIGWENPSDDDFQECELTYFYGAADPKTVTIQSPNKSFTINAIYDQNYTLILKTKDDSGNLSAGITKKVRFGNLSTEKQADVDAFDKNTVAILAGKLNLKGTGITNISNLSNLEQIEGKFDIIGTGITNLDAFSKLNFIVSYINITNNKNLSNFCGLKNLINSGGAPTTYTVTGNASNPTKQEILNNCP